MPVSPAPACEDMALADISPVAAVKKAQAGAARQGGLWPRRCAAAMPLTDRPGCAIGRPSGGGISSRAAPFPKIGKGRGEWVERTILNYGGFEYETTPCVYYRLMVNEIW